MIQMCDVVTSRCLRVPVLPRCAAPKDQELPNRGIWWFLASLAFPLHRVGLDLEHVVHIRGFSPAEAKEAGSAVDRQKKRPPAAVLSHMDSLVDASPCESVLVDPDHDVSQG